MTRESSSIVLFRPCTPSLRVSAGGLAFRYSPCPTLHHDAREGRVACYAHDAARNGQAKTERCAFQPRDR
jgi:hypothetical protein